MKKTETLLKDYVSRLSIDNLKYLHTRFNQRISSDLAEAVESVSANPEMDKWLAAAKSSGEFYDMVDLFQGFVERELHKRAPELVEA